jgi:hypothetical protein
MAEEGRMRGRTGTVPPLKCGGEGGPESSEIFLAGENERAFEVVGPRLSKGVRIQTGSETASSEPLDRPLP